MGGVFTPTLTLPRRGGGGLVESSTQDRCRTILTLPRQWRGFKEVMQITVAGAMSHSLPRIILDDDYARQGHSAVSWRYARRTHHLRLLLFDTVVLCHAYRPFILPHRVTDS
jgi:hypothetical protein